MNRLLSQRRWIDRVAKLVLAACASTVLVVTGTILVFVGKSGITGFLHSGLTAMLLGLRWKPNVTPPAFGLLPLIFGTLVTALGSVLLGALPAVLCATYLSEFATRRIHRAFRRVMEIAAALPSVVYGYVAVTYLVPALSVPRARSQGLGITATTLVLAIMIAPTVTLLSLDALARTPVWIRDASAALGVSRWQTTFRAVVPTAWRGLLIATVLGFARASGEAMAVQMVLDLFRPTSTIATTIVTDLPNTQLGTPWNNALFSMSMVLLLISTAVVLTTRWLARRAAY